MKKSNWLELCQLAEKYCPHLLLDLPALTEDEAQGVLRWLRRKAAEVQ